MNSPALFERKVLKWARDRSLIVPGDHVVVAVSGGPDSVALLLLFQSWRKALNLTLWVGHINHGLRGKESEEDAEFVAELCDQIEVPFIQKRLALGRSHSQQKGLSLQALAREGRYKALVETGKECRATKIALGHTRDDQAETVMMWMLRGCGAAGLAGMQPLRSPHFIRPLLQVSRPEILSYLTAKGWGYREDSSNLSPVYLRNRIRQELLPVLKRFNPGIVRVLSRQAEILREETEYLDLLAREARISVTQDETEQGIILSSSGLLGLPLSLRRRVILMTIQQVAQKSTRPRFDMVETVVERIVKGQSGSSVQVGGVIVAREYEEIRFQSLSSGQEAAEPVRRPELAFPIPSILTWPPTSQTIEGQTMPSAKVSFSHTPDIEYFDASSFTKELIVRSWKAGDYFCPLGLEGKRKKIQDFFSDIKLSQSKRKMVPLLVAPEGILWVGGYRADHRFRVRRSTQEVLMTRISQNPHSK